MVSQCTKFEVSRFTRYKAENGGAKCRKWGGLGVFRGHCVILRFAVLVEHRLVTDGRTQGHG